MAASALLAAASVASLNLCTDEYLLLLGKSTEIASVSFLSQDPQESPLWKLARRHHANRGSLEDVLRQKPRVVLTMGGGGRATSLIAARLGLKPIDLRPVTRLDDIAWNLRTVASALGRPTDAKPWLQRLARVRSEARRPQVDAIWLGGGGQTLSMHSVGADWLRLAGLQQRPVRGGRVSLETILVRPPAVLVESSYRSGQFSRGAEWLHHPVVRNAKSRRVRTDGRAWTCMGPLVIGEIERIRSELG